MHLYPHDMKKPFEQLIADAAPKESLTSEERSRMRSMLREYAHMKPRREGSKEQKTGSSYTFFPLFLRQPMGSLVAASLILVAGFGAVAAAAEGSLP